MKRFLDYIAEATGPEGRELSKKVNNHFEGIRTFIGAISGGKANEFQDHVLDGVRDGHDNHMIINNHGPLKNHGMVRSDDGDDYTADIHKYIDAVRDQHEYHTDVRDDSEKFYYGEAANQPVEGQESPGNPIYSDPETGEPIYKNPMNDPSFFTPKKPKPRYPVGPYFADPNLPGGLLPFDPSRR